MKGFVPTPVPVVNLMVEKLFRHRPPKPSAIVLDPGCGQGEFVDGVIRWCVTNHKPVPKIVGIESDPRLFAVANERFQEIKKVEIRHGDFLTRSRERFDYIVGNPPYVPITDLSIKERATYRTTYATARGRFDLYLLFFEQALNVLKPEGRLVFITPEKFLYVETAAPLRNLLRQVRVDELHFLPEQTFGNLVTYPLVSTITASAPGCATRIVPRDGRETHARLDQAAGSWLPTILGFETERSELVLADVCIRISCGVATGADSVFVVRDAHLDPHLRAFARPTIAGRQITPGQPIRPLHSLLVPYSEDGRLLPEERLGRLGHYLSEPARRDKLLARTCVARKAWYAFHENPPMLDVLRPKLLCKDISPTPFFVQDRMGSLIPRHSVYYVVPVNEGCLDELTPYLNSPYAQQWLRNHCQRAANGFLRLQSHVLKRLPLPASFRPFQRPLADRRSQLEAQLV